MTVFHWLWIAGFSLAIVRWKRHPGVSFLTAFAFMLYFVSAYLMKFMGQPLSVNQPYSIAPAVSFSNSIPIIRAFLDGGATILIMFALFGWRGQEKIDRGAAK